MHFIEALMIQVTPVILCGGSGARLWPLSRTGLPKQFLCLAGNEHIKGPPQPAKIIAFELRSNCAKWALH